MSSCVYREERPEHDCRCSVLWPLSVLEYDLAHVADLGSHPRLAGLGPHGGEGVVVGPPVVRVVFTQHRPRERHVELVWEGVEGLLQLVALHLGGPQGLLVSHGVKQTENINFGFVDIKKSFIFACIQMNSPCLKRMISTKTKMAQKSYMQPTV